VIFGGHYSIIILMKRVFVLGLGIGLFIAYVNIPDTPRSKDVDLRQVLGGRAARSPTAVPTGENRYLGQYMSFTYPARARMHPVEKGNEAMLEVVDLEIDIPRLSITAAVSKASEGLLDEIPGVRLRRQQTSTYSEEKGVFTKSDGREITAFRLGQGRLYTLSVSGNDKLKVADLWITVFTTWTTF